MQRVWRKPKREDRWRETMRTRQSESNTRVMDTRPLIWGMSILVLATIWLALPALAQDDEPPTDATEASVETDAVAEPAPTFEDGYEAYQRGNFYEARMIWEDVGAEGDARALYNLGTLYAEGRGVNLSLTQAQDYWDLAAEAGNVRAMHNLALAHITTASALDEDEAAAEYSEALRLLEQAAADGFANSQYTLGKMYQYGLDVPQSDERAAEYFHAAADQGFANAQYNLGKAYRDGAGVERNDELSIYYFMQAAENGHARAQNRLATRFARGDGVPQDDVQALYWATLAAHQGDERAAENRAALLDRMSDSQIAEAEALLAAE